MIDPTVRDAVVDDATALAELEREARHMLTDRRGGQRWLATHPARGQRWDATIGRGGVVVAHIDDVVVGYLALSIDGVIARVDEVYVTPGAREVGFGDELLARAVVLARSAGAELLEGEALPGDRDTKNLYERAGITARLIVVSTRL